MIYISGINIWVVRRSFVQCIPSSYNRFLDIVCSSWTLGLILAAPRIVSIRLERLLLGEESNGEEEEFVSSFKLTLLLELPFFVDDTRLSPRLRLSRFFDVFVVRDFQFEVDELESRFSVSELNDKKVHSSFQYKRLHVDSSTKIVILSVDQRHTRKSCEETTLFMNEFEFVFNYKNNLLNDSRELILQRI